MTKSNFFYDIHGIVRIRSERRLPELGYFLSEASSPEDIDIDVRITANPSRFRCPDSVIYDEIAGRFGFSIIINRDDTTEVFASPLIGMSRHVLYTNVVEPLVRWTLVRKGFALMHGACLAFGNDALFITARTDTGKTTTILHTLRHSADTCTFLSDDMTIFSPNGAVYSYPKPLTISFHTLQAVDAAPLKPLEQLFLQVQSRLHSKGGRQAGMWLNDISMPAATLSAIVQKLIPPPKYMVDRLIPGTTYKDSAQLARIVVIERGPEAEEMLDKSETLSILSANSEDAYGFPPYPHVAHELTRWGDEDLSAQEKHIVAAAVSDLPATYLKSDSYSWYKRLPDLATPESRAPFIASPQINHSFVPSIGD